MMYKCSKKENDLLQQKKKKRKKVEHVPHPLL